MNILEELRAQKQLTIRDLAEKAGLNPTTVVRIEKGRTLANTVTVGKLAKALDVPIDDLLELTGEKLKAKRDSDKLIINAVYKEGKPIDLVAASWSDKPLKAFDEAQELLVRLRSSADIDRLKQLLEDNGFEVDHSPYNE